MAGTVTLLGTQTFDTTSGTHTVVATPAADDLIVIVVASTGNTANIAPTDNNSDGAGIYSRVNTCVKNTSADTMQMWIRESKVGSASSTTFSHAPGTSTGGGLAVFKITGMLRAGLTAVVQSAIQSNQAAAGTPTPVLGTAANTNNPLIGAVFNATNPATMTPRGTPVWTERQDSGYATPTTGLETMSINSGETGTSIAWGGTSASAFCSIVAEFNAGAAPQATFLPQQRIRTARRINKTTRKRRDVDSEPSYPPTSPKFYAALYLASVRVPNRRKRTNTTQRRKREVESEPSYPPTAVLSPDRALYAPFVTRTQRVRKLLVSPAPISFPAAPSVVPAAAWITRQTPKRKTTKRRVLSVNLGAIERYTPPSIAWAPRPQVKPIRFNPKLIKQSPQLLYPPTTGPPPTAQGYPAWLTTPLPRTFQARKLLVPRDQPLYPETPKPEPNMAGRIPVGFRRRKQAKRKALVPRLDVYPAGTPPVASPDRALDTPFVTRTQRARRLQVPRPLPSVDAAPPPVSQAPVDATQAKRLKKRRARQGLFLSAGGPVEARVQPQFPSWATTPTKKRKSTKRTLRNAPGAVSFPATPAAPAQPQAAWALKAPFRREDSQRKPLKLAPNPATPATPAVPPQPQSAWELKLAKWRADARRRTKAVPVNPATPATPPPPVEPQSAWRLVVALKRRDLERRLVRALHSPRYSQAPVPPQPFSAWKLARSFFASFKRKLIPAAPQITYPETPPTGEIPARYRGHKPGTHPGATAPKRTAVAPAPKRQHNTPDKN
jgi:hypothetical protein